MFSFLCTGITWDIYQYKIAHSAFSYNSSLKKKVAAKECNQTTWFPKLKHAHEA